MSRPTTGEIQSCKLALDLLKKSNITGVTPDQFLQWLNYRQLEEMNELLFQIKEKLDRQ